MANHTEAVPCNPQAINVVLPSISDTTIVSKAITQLSGQRCPTHPEAESSTLELISKLDTSSCLGVNNDPPLNPKCMTTSDWVEAQSKEKNVGEVICLLKVNELQCQKVKETDSQEMTQFIRQ